MNPLKKVTYERVIKGTMKESHLINYSFQVILVKWNEPYQKLASCDSQGVIFVWIKHEGRWSIELINDRNSQVMNIC